MNDNPKTPAEAQAGQTLAAAHGSEVGQDGVCESCAHDGDEYFAYLNRYTLGTRFSCKKCGKEFYGPLSPNAADHRQPPGE